MKRVRIYPLVILVLVGGFFGGVNAQGQAQSEEAIVSLHSDVVVNIDNSVDVTETVTYNTGPLERHGIYRDIYPYSSQNRKISIENIGVSDENGSEYQFQVLSENGNTRIKIGDPNTTFNGQKIYIIKYRANKAVAQLDDIDEIYWNASGNEWNIPIYSARVSVTLPPGASALQSACYYGQKGSTSQCGSAKNVDGVLIFDLPTTLNSREGMTVAVGFQKGIVTAYTAKDDAKNFFATYLPWIVATILPIVTFIFSFLYWRKKGRDDRETGVIVPQYDVPQDLTPMETVGIVFEKVTAKNISAEIIYLATKGYIKIRQMEETTLGFIKSSDYELTKLKSFSDLPNEFDVYLLSALFQVQPTFTLTVSNLKKLFGSKETLSVPEANQVQTVKLSDLQYVFYKDAHATVASVITNLKKKGYYKNLGRMSNNTGSNNVSGVVGLLFQALLMSAFFGGIFGTIFFRENPIPVIIGVFLSSIIFVIFNYFSPSKTEKGVIAKEYILGLKEYLQIAEKDRLLFHNAPDKRPEVFEKLLPYAMALGVANIWAKEFEGIYTTPPSWYSGSPNAVFSAVAFNNTLNSFSSFASSSLTSSPSSSGGSGGGGSSGGGGGGGGGGGW